MNENINEDTDPTIAEGIERPNTGDFPEGVSYWTLHLAQEPIKVVLDPNAGYAEHERAARRLAIKLIREIGKADPHAISWDVQESDEDEFSDLGGDVDVYGVWGDGE
jgi:hypothetical protein